MHNLHQLLNYSAGVVSPRATAAISKTAVPALQTGVNEQLLSAVSPQASRVRREAVVAFVPHVYNLSLALNTLVVQSGPDWLSFGMSAAANQVSVYLLKLPVSVFSFLTPLLPPPPLLLHTWKRLP